MSNTWIIYPAVGDSLVKAKIIPNTKYTTEVEYRKGATAPLKDESASH